MKINHYVSVYLNDLNYWEEIVNSRGTDEISGVVIINEEEYNAIKEVKNTQTVDDKVFSLKHTPNATHDGSYRLIEYKIIDAQDNSFEVFLKTEKSNISEIDNNATKYHTNFPQYSPLNSNSSCGGNPCFMAVWGIFSLLGLALITSMILGLLNGSLSDTFNNLFSDCRNCVENVREKFNFSEEEDLLIEENTDPFSNPLNYLKNYHTNKDNKLDVTLLWLSQNDLDLIAVDPNGNMLWKNNPITSYGIMDFSDNDSQFNERGEYSLEKSILESDSLALEHLSFPARVDLVSGSYKIYVLFNDKRLNCGKSEQYFMKVVHDNKTQFYSGQLKNTLNNRCLNELTMKEVYTAEKLSYYQKNSAAELIFELIID